MGSLPYSPQVGLTLGGALSAEGLPYGVRALPRGRVILSRKKDACSCMTWYPVRAGGCAHVFVVGLLATPIENSVAPPLEVAGRGLLAQACPWGAN